MSKYKIDRNIAIPNDIVDDFKQLVREMEHGDSVAIDDAENANLLIRILHNFGFDSRSRYEENKKIYRIWKLNS